MQKMNKKKKFIIGVCLLLLLLVMLKGAAVFSHSADVHGREFGRIRSFNLELFNYLNDSFLMRKRTLEVPSYTLAEDFPKEHIKTFNDFLLFYASVEQTRVYSRRPVISVVKARLELNNPVRYEDFLAAVLLSVSFVGHDGLERVFEQRPRLLDHYVEMFRFPSRNSFFIENILKPLIHDLRTGEYRGYRFKNENLLQLFREFIHFCYYHRHAPFSGWFDSTSMNREDMFFHVIRIMIPGEIFLANYYAQTFLLIHNGRLHETYIEMYRYAGMYRFFILEEHQLLPPRPYYFYSDEDRYLWFEFLQSELRSAEHADFADEILEIEIEHYRELINWQLQLRAYLTQKLYEYGDSVNLSTLKELLTTEYINLKNNSLFQHNFEMAIETLRDLDDKVRNTSPFDSTKGDLVLPWIDREAIDYKQGIRSEIISVYPEPITWKTAVESIDDETKEEMKDSYEKSIYSIRVLTVINEKLNLERDLTKMVQLHSRLANNRNINYTPTGVFHRNFSALKNTYGDGENFPELDAQTRLNLRRYGLIANDFWGRQARRMKGDMMVGDIILPWVRVWDEVP